jgi:hypothetical protein
MTATHKYHTATLLPSGKVLVVEGFSSATNRAELYDPATGTWTTTGTLNIEHGASHTATLLPNGNVLVAGGGAFGPALADAELYDPIQGIWTTTATMNIGRFEHSATLLPNGKVLVAGGRGGGGGGGGILNSAELYNLNIATVTLGNLS